MKANSYEFPKSSFLSLEKDANLIIQKILGNDNIKKMLFYQDKHCLELPKLDDKQTISLINNQIIYSPKIEIDKNLMSYLFVSFDDFVPNGTNPQYRDNMVEFDIICHYNSWNLGDFRLRPYKIAGELDSMFNNQRLTGIGVLNFIGAKQINLNDEFGGVSLIYAATHGSEDKND